MELFFSNKKSNVSYIIDDTCFKTIDVPTDIFYPVEKQNNINIGCPATTSLENRLYYIPSFADIEIEFGLENGQPVYSYVFNDNQLRTSPDIHELLKQMFIADTTEKNNVVNFQVKLPYLFVTDDETIEVNALVPNIKTNNCTFMPGGFHIYGWIRHINSAWILNNKNKKAKIYFKQGEPMVYIYFNKAVKLEEIEFTPDIYKYHKRHSKSVNYVKNLTKIFNRVIKKRPKKFL